jgi:hypothetical protein
MNNFLVIRICSKLGIVTRVVDAKMGHMVRDSEDFLLGSVYPVFGWEPYNCAFYGAWLRRKLKEKLFGGKIESL